MIFILIFCCLVFYFFYAFFNRKVLVKLRLINYFTVFDPSLFTMKKHLENLYSGCSETVI